MWEKIKIVISWLLQVIYQKAVNLKYFLTVLAAGNEPLGQ